MESTKENKEQLFWYNASLNFQAPEKCIVCHEILDPSTTIVTHTFPKDLTQASDHLYHLQCIAKVTNLQFSQSNTPNCPLCTHKIEHLSLKKIIVKNPEVAPPPGLRSKLPTFAKLLDPVILKSRRLVLEEECRINKLTNSKMKSTIKNQKSAIDQQNITIKLQNNIIKQRSTLIHQQNSKLQQQQNKLTDQTKKIKLQKREIDKQRIQPISRLDRFLIATAVITVTSVLILAGLSIKISHSIYSSGH